MEFQSLALEIHENELISGVSNAIKDRFSFYALYASRMITLSHPEVLVKADSRFIDHITTNRGYSNSYSVKNVHSREFLTDMQFRKYPPFSFDAVDFESLQAVNQDEIYPENYPVLPYIDRRMLPLSSTLKTRKSVVTKLEKIALLYQKERIKRKSHDGLFIIHCNNEETCLFKDDQIIDTESQIKTELTNSHPILIFNEEYVWYPLMDRDDTDKNSTLQHIVEKYCQGDKYPTLTDFEKSIIVQLKETTKLTNNKQKAMAEICCLRSTGRQTCTTPLSEWFPLHALWDIALPSKKARAWQYYGYLEQILIRANKLSPIAAHLASLSMKVNGYDKLVVLYKEWIKRVALSNYSYVWGHLWDECLVEYSIDESFRTSAGHCMVQGMIFSAILEMLNIDNYLMEGEVPGSHHYVWVPEYEATFDNAKLKMSVGNVMLNWPRGNKVLARFHHEGKFCSPIAGGEYSGSFSPEECVAELDKLEAKYGNTLIIYANGKHETQPTVDNRNNRALTEDYHQLLNEEWEDLVLP